MTQNGEPDQAAAAQPRPDEAEVRGDGQALRDTVMSQLGAVLGPVRGTVLNRYLGEFGTTTSMVGPCGITYTYLRPDPRRPRAQCACVEVSRGEESMTTVVFEPTGLTTAWLAGLKAAFGQPSREERLAGEVAALREIVSKSLRLVGVVLGLLVPFKLAVLFSSSADQLDAKADPKDEADSDDPYVGKLVVRGCPDQTCANCRALRQMVLQGPDGAWVRARLARGRRAYVVPGGFPQHPLFDGSYMNRQTDPLG